METITGILFIIAGILMLYYKSKNIVEDDHTALNFKSITSGICAIIFGIYLLFH